KGWLHFEKKESLVLVMWVPKKSCKELARLYELRLPSVLASVHPVFHVSMIRKCIGDPESIPPIEGLGVKDNLCYEEVLVQILDRQVKKLRNKEGASVKVLWKNHLVEGATWEAEADMMSYYPHLFYN
ncbi:hypothetical protein EJD97_017684, partial [Solanum chilense]